MFLVSRRSGCTWLSLRMFTVKEPQFGRSFKIAEILDWNFLETTKESHVCNPGDIYKQTTVPLLPSPIAFTTLMCPFYPLKGKPEQKTFSPPPLADRPVSLLLLSLSQCFITRLDVTLPRRLSNTLSLSPLSQRSEQQAAATALSSGAHRSTMVVQTHVGNEWTVHSVHPKPCV